MNEPPPAILLLLGPTAGGKTSLSVRVASALPAGAECVLADSMQIYRGMVIGTAQPKTEEMRDVPHHLCGVVDPAGNPFSAHDWLAAATQAIEDIRIRNRTPIVVGGTNLYARALLEGLFDGPGRDEVVRSRLEALDDESLFARLKEVDPASASRLHPRDRRRVVRALEVHETTGTPLSEHQREWQDSMRPREDVRVAVLAWSTPEINRRINARVRAMMENGFLDEVDALRRSGGLGPQAAEAVGYRELGEHLDGRLELADAVEQIKIRTRRFAKQQRTWLRRFAALPGAITLRPEEEEEPDMVSRLRAHLG